MLKITIDANVFVSALLTPGNSEIIANHLKESVFALFYPKHLIFELQKIPFKRRLKGRIKQHQIDTLIESIAELGTLIELTNIPPVCRDPDDDVYLACIIAAECDYLISGDPDLTDLKEHGRTKIVNPAEFVRILQRP